LRYGIKKAVDRKVAFKVTQLGRWCWCHSTSY